MTQAQTETFGTYEFGMTEEQEQRAARLHAESIIVDLLFLGPSSYLTYTDEMDETLHREFDRLGWRGGQGGLFRGRELQFRLALEGRFDGYRDNWYASGVTAGDWDIGLGSIEELALSAGQVQAQCDRFPWLSKALTAQDIRTAKAEDRKALFINTQSGYGAPDNFDVVRGAYDLGMRVLQLTANPMTSIGAGCTERTDAGVSHLGARLIALMNDLGMLVDTSHCGRQTTLDACEISERPVIATHTSAGALYPHARSKSDAELDALAASGGVIGIYAIPFFLSGDEGVTIETMLDHVDYVVGRVGSEHVAIGADWPMPHPKWLLREMTKAFVDAPGSGWRPEDKVDNETNLVGFDDYRDWPNITRGLVSRGYSDEQIAGILGENFLRVFEDVCG
jgi:membrane dipeptidase